MTTVTTELPYRIDRISPTKRKGAVVAHAIVHFGPAWVRYRIVNTARGLAVFPPANPCPGPGGQTFYRKSAGIEDLDLRDQLHQDILEAFEAHQARQKRSTPPPLQRSLGKLQAAIHAAKRQADAPRAGKLLLDAVLGVLNAPESSPGDHIRAAELLMKMLPPDSWEAAPLESAGEFVQPLLNATLSRALEDPEATPRDKAAACRLAIDVLKVQIEAFAAISRTA